MKELRDEMKRLLSQDPIAIAEKLVGETYRENEAVVGLSLPIMHEIGRQKKDLAILTDDTYFMMKMKDFRSCVKRMGFQEVLEDPLEEGNFYRIWWNPDGIIISCDSYFGDKDVNGGNCYFFWGPKGDGAFSNEAWDALDKCSHGPTNMDSVRHVSYDVREGLRAKIEELREEGSFLNPWPEVPFLWLLSYMDSKVEGYDYKAITKSRIERLPKEVQDCILGNR